MKKLYLFSLLCTFNIMLMLFADGAYAQNGVLIGPAAGTANASAMLEVSSTNKGFLLPRVNLVALSNGTSPVNSPAAGLLVYNLGAGGVPAVGVYYWDGSANSWVQLTAGGMSGSGTTNYVTKWTNTNALGNSQIYDNATNVAIGTTTPLAKLDVRGTATITTGSNYGNTNNHLATGSLAIGGSNVDFGGGSNWNSNTAGLLFECLDNTEIGIHDAGTRVASAMYFQGATVNRITVGRDMGWGKTDFAVSTLTGTGHRQVYASPNGTLTTNFSTGTVFSYTGGDQSYTVPAGVTSVTVKMWGAGGGGGYYGGWASGFSGGAGGFTMGTISVSAGQVLTIIVGGGGLGGNTANSTPSYGGGARSCNTGSDCRYGGQGGGRSAIRNSGGTELITAGGGGGGGSSRNTSWSNYGGAGGGIVGQDGTSDVNEHMKGMGGFQIAGGPGGCCSSGNGSAGTQFAGGNPGSNAYGGGGGGGWYGGGGGSYFEPNTMSGGGGGSGYIGGAGVSGAYTLMGYYIQPPKMDDVNYAAGIAVGGLTAGTSTPLQGGHGRVVIIPNL